MLPTPETVTEFALWGLILLALGALAAYVGTALIRPLVKMLEATPPTKARPWRGWIPPVIVDWILVLVCVALGAGAGSRLWGVEGDVGWIVGGAGAVGSTVIVKLGFDALGRSIDRWLGRRDR